MTHKPCVSKGKLSFFVGEFQYVIGFYFVKFCNFYYDISGNGCFSSFVACIGGEFQTELFCNVCLCQFDFVVVAEFIYSFIEFGFFAHISFTLILSVSGFPNLHKHCSAFLFTN